MSDAPELLDASDVRQVLAGRKAYFTGLAERHHAAVQAVAHSVLGDVHLAEDAAQEAFLRAYTNLDMLADPLRFGGWVRRIAFAVAIDVARHLGRLRESALADDPGEQIPTAHRVRKTPAPGDPLHAREWLSELQAAIAALPARYRLPMTLYHLDGLDHQRIADRMNVPIGTVRAWISRARGKLRQAIAPSTGVDPSDLAAVAEVFDERRRIHAAHSQHATTDKEDAMLHVANGHSTMHSLKAGGVPGHLAVWADVLHEGPCPTGLDDAAWRKTRTEFLTTCGWFDFERNLETLRLWDEAFDAYTGHDELVLWFEHDLYDQLILIRHLARLAERGAQGVTLSLVCIGEYPGMPDFHGLGELTPDQLVSLLDTRQPITEAMLDLGRRAWAAFTSPDPRKIEEVLQRDTSELPFLAAALCRHLQQFPSTRNGLGRTEQQILDAVVDVPHTGVELFRHDTAAEQAVFMGDATFWVYVKRLAQGPQPLVTIDRPVAIPAPDAHDSFDAAMARARITLTDIGRTVQRGDADYVALNPLDRWLGGVHLSPDEPAWRWNVTQRRLQPAP
ncbi:MAG: sigma-70 family RNA polymerase sigma factor [Phycisphaeraceae bacterium]|nr:sigma-70 family RNA polymerase sigma factor [Phycisphaeraceae bacterium]